MLRELRVGVVGCGGAGSVIVQALAHLGVGRCTAIDDDVIKDHNLSRQVGAVAADVGAPKVDVAQRVYSGINPEGVFDSVHGNVVDPDVAHELLGLDAVFLAADSMQARHVVNAICHQYLIPGFQVGAKATVDEGRIEDAFAVARPIGAHALCLWCAGLIDPTKLAEEAESDTEREGGYGLGEPQPSVITMNMMSASLGLNDFLFMFTGLHQSGLEFGPRRYHFLERLPVVEALGSRCCRECDRKGRGDRAALPLRSK